MKIVDAIRRLRERQQKDEGDTEDLTMAIAALEAFWWGNIRKEIKRTNGTHDVLGSHPDLDAAIQACEAVQTLMPKEIKSLIR